MNDNKSLTATEYIVSDDKQSDTYTIQNHIKKKIKKSVRRKATVECHLAEYILVLTYF